MMNPLKMMYLESQSETHFSEKYLKHISSILQRTNAQEIGDVITVLKKARLEERNIFIAGNGGSAATATHFANDLTHGTHFKDKPFKGISLADNIATLTALSNDLSYEDIFVEQLKVFLKEEDLLIVISASGNSKNLINAVRYVNNHKATSIGFVGFDGGELKGLCRHCIHVETLKKEYGPSEDMHLILCHLITSYFMMSK